MDDFITIPRNVLREALERIDADSPGSDSFEEHLRSLILGRGGEPHAQDRPTAA
ncbi:MAG: hypothetical protein ACRDPC_18385 [Solirubrobacteraceae bacterium]